MGALKLTYYDRQRDLEVNSLFLMRVLEKNGIAEKKRLSSSTYGFNGMEKDNSIKGQGNSYDYGFRMQDPRLGRFLSVDPATVSFPWSSPYAFAENDVIRSIDLEGKERFIIITNLSTQKTTRIELESAGKLGEGILYVTQTAHGVTATYRAIQYGQYRFFLPLTVLYLLFYSVRSITIYKNH